MKTPFIFLLLLAALGGRAEAQNITAVPTNAPRRIELRDQFDAPHLLTFPRTNLLLLTIADRKGSAQIAAWIAPVKQRFPHRLEIHGLADVSAVPRWLRGMVRGKFQKAHTYPILLDWSGDTVQAFTYVPDQANVLLLDGQGNILRRFTGEATEPKITELCDLLENTLQTNRPPVAPP